MRSLACVLLIALTSTAHADGGDDDLCKQGAKPRIKVEIRNGKPVHVVEMIICAKPPRPSVAYVTTAKTINYEWESLKQEFLPKTLASVKKAPF